MLTYKYIRHCKICIFSIIIVIIGALLHTYLRGHSAMYNLLFPPSGLYTNLAESSFNLSTIGLTKEFTIVHKYPGRHDVALLVEKPVDSISKYDSDFMLKVTVINGDKVIFERTVSDTNFRFWGGKDRSGFSLINYEVPSELPIGLPLLFKIKVLKASAHFESKYGRQNIIIKKLSDE